MALPSSLVCVLLAVALAAVANASFTEVRPSVLQVQGFRPQGFRVFR